MFSASSTLKNQLLDFKRNLKINRLPLLENSFVKLLKKN